MKRVLPDSFVRSICVVFLFVCCCIGVKAQWVEKNNGLWGGDVRVIAENSNYLFAGTSRAGIFRSSNSGANWVAANKGLTSYRITSLGTSGNTVFAGTDEGLFFSKDNGDTWNYNSGLPNQSSITSLAVVGNSIFVSINYPNVVMPLSVYRTKDGGVTWTAVNTGLDFSNYRGILSFAASGNNLFAGSNGNGAFLSTNNGDSWTAINNGLINKTVWDFLVKGSKIFAATDAGVIVSSDNGGSWTSAGNIGQVLGFAIDNNVIFAANTNGVYVSNNDGISWASNGDFQQRHTNDVFVSGGKIFAATLGSGIFSSTNGGVNWVTSNTGLAGLSISSFVLKGSKLFVGSNNGVFVTSDNGSNWNAVNNTDFYTSDITSLAVSGDNIFAGTTLGIFLSTNEGASWVDIRNNLPNTSYISATAIIIKGSSIYLGTTNGMFVSSNNGSNWTAFNDGLSSTYIKSLFVVDNNIYTVTSDGKVFVSKNGVDWSLVDTGLIGGAVGALAVSPRYFYAADQFFGNFYISDNKTLNWKNIDVITGLSNKTVYSSAVNLDKVFLGKDDGVSFSIDNETNWLDASQGLPNSGNFRINTLAVNTTSLFAGTSAGIWSRPLSEFKAIQTLTFNALPAKAFGDASFNLAATASSGLAVTYFSSDPTVASISINKVTILKAGTTTITATQAGSDAYKAAADVKQVFIINKANQTITFDALPAVSLASPSFRLAATASSALPVAYTTTSANVALANGQVTINGAGSVTITASQAGNGNYNPATSVSQTFCVNPAKASITASNLNTSTPNLTSSATAGNQWFLNGIAIAGATNQTYTPTQSGTYKVQVTVGGCASEFSADQPLVITGIEDASGAIVLYPNPATDWLTIALTDDGATKEVRLFSIKGQQLDAQVTTGNSVTFHVAEYSRGLYIAKVQAGELPKVIKFAKE